MRPFDTVTYPISDIQYRYRPPIPDVTTTPLYAIHSSDVTIDPTSPTLTELASVTVDGNKSLPCLHSSSRYLICHYSIHFPWCVTAILLLMTLSGVGGRLPEQEETIHWWRGVWWSVIWCRLGDSAFGNIVDVPDSIRDIRSMPGHLTIRSPRHSPRWLRLATHSPVLIPIWWPQEGETHSPTFHSDPRVKYRPRYPRYIHIWLPRLQAYPRFAVSVVGRYRWPSKPGPVPLLTSTDDLTSIDGVGIVGPRPIKYSNGNPCSFETDWPLVFDIPISIWYSDIDPEWEHS